MLDLESLEIVSTANPDERLVLIDGTVVAMLRRRDAEGFRVLDAGGLPYEMSVYRELTVDNDRAALGWFPDMSEDVQWFWEQACGRREDGGFLDSPEQARARKAQYAALRAKPSPEARRRLIEGWQETLERLGSAEAAARIGLQNARHPVAPALPEDQALLESIEALRARVLDRIHAHRSALGAEQHDGRPRTPDSPSEAVVAGCIQAHGSVQEVGAQPNRVWNYKG